MFSFFAPLLFSSTVVAAGCSGTTYGSPELFGSNFGVPGTNATFDYVVVGGGTAGLTMAMRLSENGTFSVAVIEAGGFYETGNGNLTQIPAFCTYFTGGDPADSNPLVDWDFVTTPQAGANNRSLHYAQGKTLGGSSARNYMAYQRPTIQSFQKWAKEVNDESFTFENMLPFYEKSVSFTPPNNRARPRNATAQYNPDVFSSAGGPLSVSYPNFPQPWSSWAQKGLSEIGVGPIQDFASGHLLGAQWSAATIDPKERTRSDASTSFLKEALVNPKSNLIVYTETMATKVLFDGNKKATGVEINTRGKSAMISANKEVILSAGAFKSPQLLMVSGIGPRETLGKFNIPVISALEDVGKNMEDHVFFGINYKVDVPTTSSIGPNLYAYTAQYLTNRTGFLSNPGGDFLGWEKLPNTTTSSFSSSARADLSTIPVDWPDIEWLPLAAYTGRNLAYIRDGPRDGAQYTSMSVALVAPFSRGHVTISSPSAADPPVIDPAWLTHPTDVEVAVGAFKRTRAFFSTPSVQSIVRGSEVFPGPKIQSDEEILSVIRDSLIGLYHASATNAMGKVVDTKGRVFGVKGLRVVDASALPFLLPGHPQSTIYALAEKIAHEILSGC
ncbi:GMC oxidoreductase [Neofusicoccum parvum]|nr:GMC oxidoreductase [Neofusicoccum parvum]